MRFRIKYIVLFVIAAALSLNALVRAAPREIAPPIAVAYAPDRALHPTDAVEFEWHDAARDRDVPVKIYIPVDGTGAQPVIIFSHGLGGSRRNYEYLGRQWAAHGYVVVHLQHIGSDVNILKGKDGQPATRPMEAALAAASPKNAIDRALDVRFAIDQIEALNRENAKFKDRLDLKHIGVAGHSFGAQTSMLVAGQRLGSQKDLSDPRVTCAIAMSEPAAADRHDLDAMYDRVSIPMFVMTGTIDDSPLRETKAAERRIGFDHLRHAPAYLLTLTDGDHMVFSGRRTAKDTDAPQQQIIRESSTAFWDAYLRDDEVAKRWLNEKFAAAIGAAGKLESRNLTAETSKKSGS